jgi:hypothetical protein
MATEWHIPQPIARPIDFDKPNEVILRDNEEFARSSSGFMRAGERYRVLQTRIEEPR